MSPMLNLLSKWLSYPIIKGMNIFILWMLLIVLPDLYYWINQGNWVPIPYFIARAIMTSFILTSIYSVINNKIIKVCYTLLIYFIVVIFFIIDVFCITKMNDRYSYDMAGIIVGTNINEAIEFVQTFLTLPLFLFILCIIIVVCILHRLLNKKFCISSKVKIICSVILILSCW